VVLGQSPTVALGQEKTGYCCRTKLQLHLQHRMKCGYMTKSCQLVDNTMQTSINCARGTAAVHKTVTYIDPHIAAFLLATCQLYASKWPRPFYHIHSFNPRQFFGAPEVAHALNRAQRCRRGCMHPAANIVPSMVGVDSRPCGNAPNTSAPQIPSTHASVTQNLQVWILVGTTPKHRSSCDPVAWASSFKYQCKQSRQAAAPHRAAAAAAAAAAAVAAEQTRRTVFKTAHQFMACTWP
jgi:hypothetical protein